MAQRQWTIKELLRVTADYLQGKGVESPRLSAEVLLAHLLQVDRIRLYLDPEKPLQDDEIAAYRVLVRRRANREPLQHITGVQEFWSADFAVGPDVLIPRPESELLVEQAIEIIGPERSGRNSKPFFLDLGTGSGALIISLGREIPEATLCATDISKSALKTALENARRHGQRIEFVCGDLFSPFKPGVSAFDLIVTNPPYVASAVLDTLMPEIGFEPKTALDGGPDGMRYIEKIILGAPDFIKPGGSLLVEMDPGQIRAALELINRTGRYESSKAVKDYSRRNRVVVAQRSRP
jgi:release factor glutamine methyltransferase